MSEKRQCPNCKAELREVIEEVDIGVGVQTHHLGYECSKCGASYPVMYVPEEDFEFYF